jgi:hypothetical protein
MRKTTLLAITIAAAGAAFMASPSSARDQVSVEIGPPPECPYGYYDVAPYRCAPAGYYGPEWFVDGGFAGAGPWFHSRNDFHGYVNNRFHPDHGYRGPYPERGERVDPARRVDSSHFRGNEMRDGRGHIVKRH